jgi:hypothetical protein
MTGIFNAILTHLPKTSPFLAVNGSITDITVNPIIYLSQVSGPLTSLKWPNFIPVSLAIGVIEETSAIEFVDSNGNQTGKDYKDVWDIIGKYIYQGLLSNVAIFNPVVGIADSTKIINGTTYTATDTIGTIGFH